MAIHWLLALSLLASEAPAHEEIAPWQYRQLAKRLLGKSIRVREIVAAVGAGEWSPQLGLQGFRREEWLKIAPRRGWSHGLYLVSVHNHAALYVAHRLRAGDKCVIYGKVVGAPTRVFGSAYVVVAKIELGWPQGSGAAAGSERSLFRRVGP